MTDTLNELTSTRPWVSIYTHTYSVFALSRVWFFVTPRTVVCQAPLSMEFSRQEYRSGLWFPPPGDLPDPGIEPEPPGSPALAGRLFTTVRPGSLILARGHTKSHTQRCCDRPKANHRGKKAGRGLVPGNSHPIPKAVKYSSHLLACEITHSYKNWQPQSLGPFSPSPTAHTLWSVFLPKEIHFSPITFSLTEIFLKWDGRNLSLIKSWDQVWSQLKHCQFKSQSGFWPNLRPVHLGSRPNLCCTGSTGSSFHS